MFITQLSNIFIPIKIIIPIKVNFQVLVFYGSFDLG